VNRMDKAFGITVSDLKQLIADWPELDQYGDPCEVWITDGSGNSYQAVSAIPLNYRIGNDGVEWADLLLAKRAY
jgi:maltoporin